jgi:SpoIID/LytB domain protein
MKQGLKKTTFFLIAFFATTLLINLQKEPAFAHKVPTSITLNCADNAVAPLNNLKDIQTFLNCNGFNPGPIDGLAGSRTDGAIKSFQKTVGLVADGEVGPATKQAMRSYSSVSFTFQGSGWGHGVGLSQYGTKGLTELGASFCSNTSSCSSNEVVSYYFQGTSVKQLSEISLSSPDIATNNNALWVGLARNARSINLTTLPSSSPPTLFICQDNLPQVAGVQAFLSSRGFDPGTVDGAFGERTANALKNYQASVGIGQSGTINDETLNKIKSDATSDGPCESDFGPLKIAGGATINIIYSNGNCYFTGHPLLSKVPASCNIGISWSDGGRIRVGPREHKHGILKLRNKNVSSGFHVSLAVNIEKYLYGLAEMPSHWNVKALEAQALVGRSYAVFQYLKQNIPSEKTDTDAGLSSSRKDYCWCHIGSTASSQYYYGYLKEIAGPNWVQAVNNTSGKVITYDGGYTQSTVVQAFYSSSTGGKTNDNVVGFGSATPWPYLKTVDDPWSVDNRVGNPKAAWSYDFSSYQLSKNILCGDTPCFDAVTDIYVSSVSESGAALQVTMKGFKNGSAKTVTKSGRNIKSQLGFTSHYFKTSSQSDISNLSIGPITANSSTTTAVENSSSSTGDTPQYATSSSGLNYLSKAGLLNVCNETSSACQAKTISREEAAAVVTVVGGVSLDAPNAYSDDDQSLYQQATNALPYYGMQVCFGSPFQIQPSETVSRDELACLLVKSIRAGTTENLSGSIDKFSDEGASKWTNEINVLAANDVIPACSDLSDKFCPSRKITIGEVSYIVNRLVDKSLIPSSVFDVNPFQAGWTANGGEVTEASSTAVSNPNAGNDACVPQDNSTLVINSTLDIQQFLSNNGFNPGPIDGQSGPKTKNAIISFQKENGLLADGIAGNKTKAAMRAYTGCKSENFCVARDNSSAKLDSIADVQTYLANNGFNPGIIDGKMGSYTREAIKAFQRKVGLIPDGVAGARTKSEMKSYTGC